jgi:hypothetical protein
MTLYIILGFTIGFLIAMFNGQRRRVLKLRRELSDLQACYRDAIDGKLAVMRELEEARKVPIVWKVGSRNIGNSWSEKWGEQ